MDAVYENLVRRIAGEALGDARTSTLRESVVAQRADRKADCRVEAKIRREKQPKKKFELVTQLQELQGQIGQMSR